MIKRMCITIDINTEYDTAEGVKDLIYAFLEAAGDRFFAINSVAVDGYSEFEMSKGFVGDMQKHFVK